MRLEPSIEAPRSSAGGRRRRRLILHVGDFKSGSTSIQKFLRKNKDLLAENGIYFPCDKSACYTQWGQHVRLATALTGRGGHWLNEESAKLPPLEILSQFRKDIDQSPAHTVVVSSEAFFVLCRAPHLTRQVMNLFPDFDPTVIVYLRRQDSHLISGFQQLCKLGRRQPFNKWKRIIERQPGFYLRRLKSWEKAVGRENMLVRPFEIEQWTNQDLIADFIDAAGIPSDRDWFIPSRKNESLGMESVWLLQRFNRWIWRRGYDPRSGMWQRCRRWIRKNDKSLSSQSLSNIMSPDERMAYFQKFEAENREIARRYPGSTEADFFKMSPQPNTSETEKLDWSTDTIRQAIELARSKSAQLLLNLEGKGVDVSAATALHHPAVDLGQASENKLFELFAFELRKLITLRRCRRAARAQQAMRPMNWPKATPRSFAKAGMRRLVGLAGL